MDKVITTALVIIASLVAMSLMINAVYPAIARSGNAIIRSSELLDQRIETQISLVYAVGELDSDGWQSTDGDGDLFFDVWIWVKNVGSSTILSIEQTDIFFGKTGDFARIPYVDYAGGGFPSWTYSLENGTDWETGVTLKVTVHYETPLAADTYVVKVVTPAGAYDDLYFSF